MDVSETMSFINKEQDYETWDGNVDWMPGDCGLVGVLQLRDAYLRQRYNLMVN